jgi:hypothetical protein
MYIGILTWKANLHCCSLRRFWQIKAASEQGCQIFLATTYQTGTNIPNYTKYTNGHKITNGYKIDQMSIKYLPASSIARPAKK